MGAHLLILLYLGELVVNQAPIQREIGQLIGWEYFEVRPSPEDFPLSLRETQGSAKVKNQWRSLRIAWIREV
jgi:hypothetical protein